MKYTVITEFVSDDFKYAMEMDSEILDYFMNKVIEKCNDGWKPIGGVATAPITNHQGETKRILYSQALVKE